MAGPEAPQGDPREQLAQGIHKPDFRQAHQELHQPGRETIKAPEPGPDQVDLSGNAGNYPGEYLGDEDEFGSDPGIYLGDESEGVDSYPGRHPREGHDGHNHDVRPARGAGGDPGKYLGDEEN